MKTRLGGPTLCGYSRALLVVAVLLVALAASPRFLDQFTSVKWYMLEAVAAAWLLAERLLCASRGLPAFVRRTWAGWAVLGALVVLGSLRQGLGWATAPLAARASFAAVVLASCWYFRRTGLRLGPLRASVAVAAVVVIALGLLQCAGYQALPWLTAGDGRSATFGNVNIAAQFVGLALVVLLSGRSGAAIEVLAGSGLAYVFLAGTRSVALALGAALVILVLVRRLTLWPLLRIATMASVVAWIVLQAAPQGSRPFDPSVETSKQMSAGLRLAVWGDTIDLIRDHPLGVGAGNFEHAFIPYALRGRSRPGETLVYRSPHNDYLRLLAEEGLPGGILLLTLVGMLALQVRRSQATGWWRSEAGALLGSGAAFLVVEAFFQFPFEMASSALLAAILFGLALASAEGAPLGDAAEQPRPGGSWPKRAGDAACVLLAIAIGVGLQRVATAEYLFVNHRDDVASLERACGLDPRRVEACVEAAWLHSRAGDHGRARSLLATVLRRSPHYFPAIKLLAEDLFVTGEREAACRQVRAYEELLGSASSIRRGIATACPPGTGAGPPQSKEGY
jgi:O-antigen ligase